MKLILKRVDNVSKKTVEEYDIKLGQRTTGLRAHTITLDHQELALILRYPKYGLMLLNTLYPVHKDLQQAVPESLDDLFTART